MKTIVLALALVGSIPFSQAQQGAKAAPAGDQDTESSILTCIRRKPGAYKTFEEFKHNAPSITPSNYAVKGHSVVEQTTLGFGFTELLPAAGGSLGKRELSKKIWGYCNKDSVFIAKHLVTGAQEGEGYIPVTDVGRYAVITLHTKEGVSGKASGAGYEVSFATLDMKTGFAHVGNVQHVRQILAKDKELLDRYNLEAENSNLAVTHKTEITVPLIQEYNIKYAIEAN